jgi:hypothetical protein
VLTIADPMTAHTCLAGILLSFNQHLECGFTCCGVLRIYGWRRTTVGGSKRAAKEGKYFQNGGKLVVSSPRERLPSREIESSTIKEDQMESERV